MTHKVSDYCQHLGATHAQLLKIRDAVQRGDATTAAEIAGAVDWDVVNSEFETVVGRYRRTVYWRARRIIRNLRRPYMFYNDCVELGLEVTMLRGAIDDSPSLLITASADLKDAYAAVLHYETIHGEAPVEAPDECPWPSVDALIGAAEAKLSRGCELESRGNVGYLNGERVAATQSVTALKGLVGKPVQAVTLKAMDEAIARQGAKAAPGRRSTVNDPKSRKRPS